jgi:adenosylhomocysteinase
VLGKRGYSLRGKDVAIMGYGRTGSHIADAFRNLGAQIRIYDEDTMRKAAAQSKGFPIARDKRDLITGNEKIIIGATGKTWLLKDEIAELGHNVFFASASSKHLEIDHGELRRFIKKRTILPDIGARYELITNNVVTLLADGYPINFFEGESVPDLEIGFIPTLLFECAKLIAKNTLPNGIIEVPKALQEEIAGMHNKLCSGRVS